MSSVTRLTGFSGTLDTESIIKKLMQAESVPLNKVQKSKQFTVWQREDYQTMNTAMLSFRNSIDTLRYESSFQKTTATSSNTAVLEVASSGTTAGVSSVKVAKLATSATIVGGQVTASTADAVGVDGTVSLNGKANVTFTATSTIDSIVKDINSKAAATGVKASFDKQSGVLFLSSSQTGSNSKIAITGDIDKFGGVFGMPATAMAASGSNAEYSINGSATTISTSSNSVSVNGVQVTLRNVGEATIGATTDRSAVVDKIKDFVKQYNALIDLYSTASTTKRSRSYEPLTTDEREAMSESQIAAWEKKARQGTLYRDSILNESLSSIRSALNTPLDVGKGQIQLLSNIGVTVLSDYKENGKLQIDETKLQEALNTNFEEVVRLFVATSEDKPAAGKSKIGIADRLYNIANTQIDNFKKKMGSGSVDALDESILGKQLKTLTNQESDWKTKLQMIEDRYYKKFAAMETALQKLNNQSSSVTSMLG